MTGNYFKLKKQLEQLGYSKHLPPDAVPLVECLTADLLQTTRSLQHYMETAQEALRQRDDLLLQAEPYKCDNARLVKENNQLNKDILMLKEENIKIANDYARKMKVLIEDLSSKDEVISRMKNKCTENFRLGSGRLSARNKLKVGDKGSMKDCNCNTRDNVALDSQIIQLQKEINELKERCSKYIDEVFILNKKVELREDEIARLNCNLEGGRPLSAVMKECGDIHMGHKVTALYKECKELESDKEKLTKDLEESVRQQHEAMIRALELADKNKLLEEELSKLDKLALRVEDECNNQIKAISSENNYLHEKVKDLVTQNNKMRTELENRRSESMDKFEKSVTEIQKIKEFLTCALQEKNEFYQQIKTLQTLNTSLQEKLSQALTRVTPLQKENEDTLVSKLATKDDLRVMLEKEKEVFQTNSLPLQRTLNNALEAFKESIDHMQQANNMSTNHELVRDLYAKIDEYEQCINSLKRENSNLRGIHETGPIQNKIQELTILNDKLKRENVVLSTSLNQQNQGTSTADEIQLEKSRSIIMQLNCDIDKLLSKNNLLKVEKKELQLLYKEALKTIDSLRKDFASQQSQFERLECVSGIEKSCHSARGSPEHLKEEIHYLREQIMKTQSELIREKTVVTQLTDSQSETQKHAEELQIELINVRKQLKQASENCRVCENNLKELEAEILSLRIEKCKLIEDLKKIDSGHDKLVIEADKMTEELSVLKETVKFKTNQIEKLDNEISKLKEELISNKITAQKSKENEIRIQMLSSEIVHLKELNENGLIENKKLQHNICSLNASLKTMKLDYVKSQKEAEGLRLQLQHYVAEVKRIEDMLSHKEAERADMLENFASLSVEANILENTNHSLENESVSKSFQLQDYKNKIEDLKGMLLTKEKIIEAQSGDIASLSAKVNTLENDMKLIMEEKHLLDNNNIYLKDLCQKLQTEKNHNRDLDSELKLYENKIKTLTEIKVRLELQKVNMESKITSIEKLLSSSRKEVIQLKLALQDATTETKMLKQQISDLNEKIFNRHDEIPLGEAESSRHFTEETLQSDLMSHHDLLEDKFRESAALTKRSIKYSHSSSTL